MTRTPDDFPGERLEESIQFTTGTFVPIKIGEFSYVSGSGFAFYQDDGLTFIRSGNINSTDHAALHQLIHLADSDGPFENFAAGAVKDTDTATAFPSSSIWWTSVARTQKIVQKTIIRNGNQSPVTIQWQVFNTSGTLMATATDTIVYSGIFELSRTRVMT